MITRLTRTGGRAATGLYLLIAAAVAGAQSCPDSAVADYEQGLTAMDGGRNAEAAALFADATSVCDSAIYWQALGDAKQAQMNGADDDGAEFAQSALEAYGRAFGAARNGQDDAAGAQAARSIVELGLLTGDPLKSQNWLLVATRLEPDHPDIPGLQASLDEARGQLSTDEIDTGLSQTRGIGLVNNLLGGDVTSKAFWDADDESAGGAGGTSGAMTSASVNVSLESSIDIPIRFKSNSTVLTEDTELNVINLAKVLAAKPASTRVILTGHADVRGDDQYNLELSLARAEKIRDLLLEEEPALAGRVDAHGDGEARPIDGGDSARSHANNRRLEVTLIEADPTPR